MSIRGKAITEANKIAPTLPPTDPRMTEYENHFRKLFRDGFAAGADWARGQMAAVLELHKPVEIEPSDTICDECSYRLPNGRYLGKVEEYPCPTVRAIEEGA